MNSRALLLLAGVSLAAACVAAPPAPSPAPTVAPASLRLLDVSGRAPDSNPPAILAGEPVVLRLFFPPGTSLETLRPRLFQTAADALRIPLNPEMSLAPDPADPRVALARFVAPPLIRAAPIALDFGAAGSLPLVIFPVDKPRADQLPLTAALSASRLRLAVAGPSPELRAYLRAERIDFTDLGASAPASLERGVLLLAELTPDAWLRLATPAAPAGASLLAFLAEPALLPGVYAEPAARRAKITLPLLPLLPEDPRARATLHALLLQLMSSPAPELVSL